MSSVLDRVALVVEKRRRFGGAQRLLARLGEILEKPIYVVDEGASDAPAVIWNTPARSEIPEEPVLLSGLMRSDSELLTWPFRKSIKLCHSYGSIANSWRSAAAREVTFLCYRERVHEFCRAQALDAAFIPKGFIPYDATPVKVLESEKDLGLVSLNARLEPLKCPVELVRALGQLHVRVAILGSYENMEHVTLLHRAAAEHENLSFVPADLTDGVSETVKEELLRRSAVSVHFSNGGLRDYLEYSLLDAMRLGNIPICVTSDPEQFRELSASRTAVVVHSIMDLPAAIEHVLQHRAMFLDNVNSFMKSFFSSQRKLELRWVECLSSLVSRLTM